MKEKVNPADAHRLAQAWQIVECNKRDLPHPTDREGNIMPTDEAHAYVKKNYDVTDEAPPKSDEWWLARK
jgi:hypothetical protein